MPRTDFNSEHTIELVTREGYREAVLSVGLRCTSPGYKGSFDPRWGGEPPAAPEFEMVWITFIDEGGKEHDLPEALARGLFGEEIVEEIIDEALNQALESGEF